MDIHSNVDGECLHCGKRFNMAALLAARGDGHLACLGGCGGPVTPLPGYNPAQKADATPVESVTLNLQSPTLFQQLCSTLLIQCTHEDRIECSVGDHAVIISRSTSLFKFMDETEWRPTLNVTPIVDRAFNHTALDEDYEDEEWWLEDEDMPLTERRGQRDYTVGVATADCFLRVVQEWWDDITNQEVDLFVMETVTQLPMRIKELRSQ